MKPVTNGFLQVGELREMRRSIEEREQQLGEKNDEIRKLKAEGGGGGEEMKAVQLENESLKLTLDKVQSQLDTSLDAQEQQRKVLEAINRQFGDHLHQLCVPGAGHRNAAARTDGGGDRARRCPWTSTSG